MFTARYGLIPQTRLVFITVMERVYSAVRTDSLYRVAQKERMFFK